MNSLEEIKQWLISLERKFPNNMEFGQNVRHIVWGWQQEENDQALNKTKEDGSKSN